MRRIRSSTTTSQQPNRGRGLLRCMPTDNVSPAQTFVGNLRVNRRPRRLLRIASQFNSTGPSSMLARMSSKLTPLDSATPKTTHTKNR